MSLWELTLIQGKLYENFYPFLFLIIFLFLFPFFSSYNCHSSAIKSRVLPAKTLKRRNAKVYGSLNESSRSRWEREKGGGRWEAQFKNWATLIGDRGRESSWSCWREEREKKEDKKKKKVVGFFAKAKTSRFSIFTRSGREFRVFKCPPRRGTFLTCYYHCYCCCCYFPQWQL